MKKLIDLLTTPYRMWREHLSWKKRLKELRKRDPFIYK